MLAVGAHLVASLVTVAATIGHVSGAVPEKRCGHGAPADGRRCPASGCTVIGKGGRLQVGDMLVPHCGGQPQFWGEVEEDGDFVVKNATGHVKWRASGKMAPTHMHNGIPSMAKKGVFFWVHALNRAWQKGTLFSGGLFGGDEEPRVADGQFRPASSAQIYRGPVRLVVEEDRMAAMVADHITWSAELVGAAGELRLMENGEMILANISEVAGNPGARDSLRIPLEEGAAGEPIKSVLDYYCLDYWLHERKVETKACHSRTNQRWRFDSGALKTAHNLECMDLSESFDVIIRACDVEAPNQRWSVDDEGRIRTPSTGLARCLEATAGPGGRVRAVECTSDLGQRWTRSKGPAWRSGQMPEYLHGLHAPPPALVHSEEL